VRAGAPLFRNEDDAAPAGVVTSGGFAVSSMSPSPWAMCRRTPQRRAHGSLRNSRGKRLGMIVSKLPFVPARYNIDSSFGDA